MTSDSTRALRAGVLVVGAAAVLAALVFRLSGDAGLFRDLVSYRTRFTTTQGLSEGAAVRFKGVTVGSVESIDFSEDPSESQIIVTLGVRRSVAPRLDRHVVAELRASSPLGDKLLELRRPDLPREEPLAPGSFLASKPPFEFGPLMDEGEDLFADLRSISRSLNVITSRLVAGEGLFGRLLKDKEFGERTLTDLEVTLTAVREMTEDTAAGRTLLGRLVSDEEFADRLLREIDETSRNLGAITTRIEKGEGTLGRLISHDEELERAIADLGEAARNFRSLSERLGTAEGSIAHRLLFDVEYGERVSGEVEAILASVASVTAKIDRGEGSAGLLVNDPQVYQGVNDIVRGVQKSWFISYILQKKQKKGFRDRVDRILAESEDPDAELVALVMELLEVDGDEIADGPAGPSAPDPPVLASPGGGAP